MEQRSLFVNVRKWLALSAWLRDEWRRYGQEGHFNNGHFEREIFCDDKSLIDLITFE